MKLAYSLLVAGLLAVPAAAQPVLIPLSPQKQVEPPPPPPPSPVPVAPPQVGIPGSPEGTGARVVRRGAQGQGAQGQDVQERNENAARMPER